MEGWQIDYQWCLSDLAGLQYDELVLMLSEDLSLEWAQKYRLHKLKFDCPHDLQIIPLGTFEYIYDSQYLRSKDANIEPRVVAAYGRTNTQANKRDSSRMKYLFGATEKVFGKGWDKGHFIANSMGGRDAKHEINIFPQN